MVWSPVLYVEHLSIFTTDFVCATSHRDFWTHLQRGETTSLCSNKNRRYFWCPGCGCHPWRIRRAPLIRLWWNLEKWRVPTGCFHCCTDWRSRYLDTRWHVRWPSGKRGCLGTLRLFPPCFRCFKGKSGCCVFLKHWLCRIMSFFCVLHFYPLLWFPVYLSLSSQLPYLCQIGWPLLLVTTLCEKAFECYLIKHLMSQFKHTSIKIKTV